LLISNTMRNIPLSGTALQRGHDRGVGPIKMNKADGTSPYILICMMVKVPAVLIVTKSYLTDSAAVPGLPSTLHVLSL
jgi:hypothetical protein